MYRKKSYLVLKISKILLYSFIFLILLLGNSTKAESAFLEGGKSIIVNIQVDLTCDKDRTYIDKLITEIEKYNGYATFFVNEDFAFKYPEILKKIEIKKHQIAVYGWKQNKNLSNLNPKQQLKLIQKAFLVVRSAVSNPEKILDFKPQGYKFDDNTIKILQNFGARSISSIFSSKESFCKCWYAKRLGKITFPYPITDKFWAIPISQVEIKSKLVPLDDKFFNDSQEFLNALIKKYNELTQTKEPLIITIHPSITGANESRLNTFSKFLEYVEKNNGKIKPLAYLCHHTQYISNFDVSPSKTTASVGEEITISGKYNANIYCPHYRFRVYGRYKDLEKEWKILDSYCEFVYTGEHPLSWKVKIPMFPEVIPPPEKYIYQIRVVGRASFGGCGESDLWPTYDSWEAGAKKDIEIEVKPKCILMNGTGDPHNYDIVFIPALFDESQLATDFAKAVAENWKTVTETPPFSSYIEKFNVWRIEDSTFNKCEKPEYLVSRSPCSGKNYGFRYGYWKCDEKEARKLAKRYCFDVDTTVVLINVSEWGGYRWGKRCSIGGDVIVKPKEIEWWQKLIHRDNIIVHELGHSFGLADEYVPYEEDYCSEYRPCSNCDISIGCPKWEEKTECIKGCTCANDYRPSHECIMNKHDIFCSICSSHLENILKNLYGKFGRTLINNLSGEYYVKNQVYSLLLTYDADNEIIILKEVEVIDGFPQEDVPEATFRYEIISFNDKIIYSGRFINPLSYELSIIPPENYVLYDEPIPLPEPILAESKIIDFILLIPYFANAKVINIYNSTDQLLLSVDVSQYATGIIKGKITDYNGNPVKNAFIQITGVSQDSAYTNENGEYQIVGAKPGSYTISVRSDPYTNLMSVFTSIGVSAGEIITKDFSLNPAASIAGEVTDINGNPIANASLYLSGYEMPHYTTNEEGKYVIPYLQAGTQTINIDAPGYENWYIFVNGSYVKYGKSVTVETILGQTTWVNFTQQSPPSPDIQVDPESFNITVPIGEIRIETLTIANLGNALLEFEIEDHSLGMVIEDPSESGTFDVKKFFITFTLPNINFNIETYTSLEGTEGWGYFWLDTDQNPSTGATEEWWPGYGLNDIGADYVLYFYFYEGGAWADLYKWNRGYFEWISGYPVSLERNLLKISIPLSDIEDDGVIDVTFAGEGYPDWQRDIVPDVGHGTTKANEIDWLSLNPEYGTIEPDNQMSVTLTIDATNLNLGEYHRYIVITSNDIDEEVTYIPVNLTVITPLGDLDNDGDVDQHDLNILLTYRNQPASACPECDIDGDGIITVLDARKLVLLCTRPRCATE